MKKFDPKRIIGYLIITLFAINGKLYSQSSSFGNTYIFNNGEMGIVNIQHNFFNGGSGIQPGTVGTDRTITQGFISFVGTASWTGASDAMHVDGYVKTYMTTAFTFPIGDNGKYRPAAISTATLANPANAAYYGVSATTAITTRLRGGNEPVLPASGPFNTALMGAGVISVDNVEYWDINGATSAKITLTWDATSAITSLGNVSILGWNGTQWVNIASTVDSASLLGGSSSLTSGSITTNASLVPDTYEVYTLGTICAAGTTAPTLSGTTLANSCPSTTVDLNSLVTSSTPSAASLVWFTNNTHFGTAYATPTTADAGTYYAFYYDSVNNCYSPAGSAVTVSITLPPDVPSVASTTQPSCIVATGTIVFTVQSGVEYSINNGTTYQASATFAGLAPGSYTLKVRNISSILCSAVLASPVIINSVPSIPSIPIASVTVQPTCEIITATVVVSSPVQGTGFEYSIDGDAYQTSSTFIVSTEGSHAITTRRITDITCVSDSASVNVYGYICAITETTPAINGASGGNTSPLTNNDTLNGLPVTVGTGGNVTISVPNPLPTGLTLNTTTGVVTVAPNTPAGNYPVVYTICEVLNPSNCDTVTSYVLVFVTDFTPTIDIDNVVFSTAGITRDFVVNISNIESDPSVGQIVFKIFKQSAFTITYDPSGTTSNVGGGTLVNNNDWIVTENSFFITVTLKPNVVINASTFSSVGFSITRNSSIPPQTWQPITATIVTGSGGDSVDDNNTYNVLIKAQ